MERVRRFSPSSTRLVILLKTFLMMACLILLIQLYGICAGVFMVSPLSYLTAFLNLCLCCGLAFITYNVSMRLNMIVGTAHRIITTHDLTQRIPIQSKWHDMSKLGAVLNSMLDQIEKAVQSTRQVSDNIAHDLRTPLTRLRNHIESMRVDADEHAETNPEQLEEFNKLIGECDALLTTFNALLRIGNIEAGRHKAIFDRINLAPVIEDVIELYEPTASDRDIRLSYRAEPCYIMGDKDLLFQALANLLDNAIKHTPSGGNVVLTVGVHDHRAKITLTDTGTGIPDAHKPYVFQRFYRITTCRSTPGSGLGLSLVQAIMKLHKASITLSDHEPSGLTVTILF